MSKVAELVLGCTQVCSIGWGDASLFMDFEGSVPGGTAKVQLNIEIEDAKILARWLQAAIEGNEKAQAVAP